jgi:radical SAM protein with 4Fe4S-binding SPASM domain
MDRRFLIQWNITDKCEFDCNHCYLHGYSKSISIESSNHILREIIELSKRVKHLELNLTGGNPFLFENIYEVFAELSQVDNIKLAVLGNPLKTKNNILVEFGSKIKYYQLSYDGQILGQKNLRGSNNIEALYNSIKILKDSKIKVNLMMTLYRENVNDLYDFLDSELVNEFDNFSFSRMVPYKNMFSESLLEAKEYRRFLYTFFNKLVKNNIANFYFKDPLWKLFFFENNLYIPSQEKWSGCGIGLGQISIMPNADILLCSRLNKKIGNLLEQSLTRIVKKANSYHPIKVRDQYLECSQCVLFYSCRGCAAITNQYNKNPFLKDPQCWI